MIDTAAFFKEARAALVVIDLQRGIAGCGISTNIGVESTARDAFEKSTRTA